MARSLKFARYAKRFDWPAVHYDIGLPLMADGAGA
jgi:hypothetical protein